VTLLSVGRVGIIGYRDRTFMYRKKSGKNMTAATTPPPIHNAASATIPKISTVYISDPPS
jgi:hypothetical protein